MAESLDPNDPLPNIIASQIHAGLFQTEKAISQAEKVKDKSKSERTYGQLANDQQGGANVGRRILEVGLPMQALEATIKTKKTLNKKKSKRDFDERIRSSSYWWSLWCWWLYWN